VSFTTASGDQGCLVPSTSYSSSSLVVAFAVDSKCNGKKFITHLKEFALTHASMIGNGLSDTVIIVIAVVGSCIVLAAVICGIIFGVPSIRERVLPYRDREHHRFSKGH